MSKSIFIAGVGGQGILLAGDVIAEAAMLLGHPVRKSEIHGMAQRGGSVTCQVRYGEGVYSPLIRRGEADVLLSLERLEAVRYLDFLRPGAVALVNDHRIDPAMLIWGKIPYPEDVEPILARRAGRVAMIPAQSIAEELGDPRIENVIMLGALSAELDMNEDLLINGIEKRLPRAVHEVNVRGFLRGRKVAREVVREGAPPPSAAQGR